MKALAGLSMREPMLIIGGVALLARGFFWGNPVAQARDSQTERIARYLAVIDLAHATDSTSPARPRPAAPDSPLDPRVTQSGEAEGIPLARLDPDGPRLRVTVSEAAFADLIPWIAPLEAQFSVRTLSVEMSRLTAPRHCP